MPSNSEVDDFLFHNSLVISGLSNKVLIETHGKFHRVKCKAKKNKSNVLLLYLCLKNQITTLFIQGVFKYCMVIIFNTRSDTLLL